MARCCDPRDEVTGTVKLEYKLGGLKDSGSGQEITATINKIDGVQAVNFEPSTQKLTLQLDTGKMTEDQLVSTLNSLGHSVLKEYGTSEQEKSGCPIV